LTDIAVKNPPFTSSPTGQLKSGTLKVCESEENVKSSTQTARTFKLFILPRVEKLTHSNRLNHGINGLSLDTASLPNAKDSHDFFMPVQRSTCKHTIPTSLILNGQSAKPSPKSALNILMSIGSSKKKRKNSPLSCIDSLPMMGG
jgi:hypothetical protein